MIGTSAEIISDTKLLLSATMAASRQYSAYLYFRGENETRCRAAAQFGSVLI